MSLAAEVTRFVRWSQRTRQRRADWAICYPHWNDAYDAVELTLAEGLLSPETTSLVLFLLERDSPNQQVLERLSAAPMCSFQIAVEGAAHPQPEVRRQVVLLLGQLASMGAIELLHRLTRDSDAGVRASALTLLRGLDPAFSEPTPLAPGPQTNE
jgi:hypothetical protein